MTITAFTPSPNVAFSFRPTLDGTVYRATVTWNLSGQRWYLNIYTLNGVLVVSRALIASPPASPVNPNSPINLVFGYFFTSTLVFWASSQQFEVDP